MSINRDKRGVVGKTMALWVATIFIVIMLLIFIIGSGVVRKVDESRAGIRFETSSEVGLGNLNEYMKEYGRVVQERFEVLKSEGVKGGNENEE